MNLVKRLVVFVGLALLPSSASAETGITYTPMLDAVVFDGIRADVSTTAVGIISCVVIVAGLFMVVKAMTS